MSLESKVLYHLFEQSNTKLSLIIQGLAKLVKFVCGACLADKMFPNEDMVPLHSAERDIRQTEPGSDETRDRTHAGVEQQ